MLDLIILFLCPWAWTGRSRKSDPELGLPFKNSNHEMIEVTVKDKESKSQSGSISDTTIGSSASEAASQDVQDKAKVEPAKSMRKKPSAFLRWIPILGRDPEEVADGRFDELIYENINTYRVGYPQWAAYQNSDPTFKVYKRFGTLRNRVILYRQQELALLEEELNRMDDEDHKSGNMKTRSLLIDIEEGESKRMKLIDQIDSKLEHYDNLLQREKRSALMEKPSKRNYRSLVNYIHNRKPVIKDEIQFLKHRDDFVLLSGPSESPLETAFDWLICRIPIRWIRRQFSSETQTPKTSDKYTTLTSPRKMALLARGTASFWAIVLITVPLSVLASDNLCQKTKLGVLLVSIIAFPVAIQIAARPRNLELFVATATYCAVLSTLLATTTTLDITGLQHQMQVSLSLGNSTAPT